jgi:hypothetical protein
VVEPPFFTDRASEVKRIRAALERPPAKLLVYGERRMGKTSAIHVARRAAERRGFPVVFADLSTASSPADMANRLLEAASRALGRRWTDFVGDIASQLQVRLQLVPDPATGLAVPTVEAELRSRAVQDQYDSFVSVLDGLEAMASARDTRLGVVLDEFQEIHRFGGEDAEWRLRGAIQHHRQIGYVLAGSDASLIRAMTGPSRAFYELFDLLPFGPIDPDHLSRWIDEQFKVAGFGFDGLGRRTLEVAGDRTRDIVRLARAAFQFARSGTGPEDAVAMVCACLELLVSEEDDRMRATWDTLTELQQNVLRAVAWNGDGLTAAETLRRFALGHAGTARNTALALEKRGMVRRSDRRVAGYDFDSPFARAWVVSNALPDAGILVGIDHLGTAKD